MVKPRISAEAKQVAVATRDAYSINRYTWTGWNRIAQMLLDAGFTAAEARWVLESKHTRWAADHASKRTGANEIDFNDYVIATNGAKSWRHLLAACRKEMDIPAAARTMTGADLAGACEGEQIADLINLARATDTYFSKVFGNPNHELAKRARLILADIEARAKGGR